MFLVDSECSESESAKEVAPLLKLFEGEEDYTMSVSWSDKLAYPIKKRSEAHRYLVNFSTSEAQKLAEFRTLSSLNPKILRHLVINIEKTYGYKSSINPKKIASAEKRAQKYQEFRSRKQRINEKVVPKTPTAL
ncbi:30S ribosomal protein S6 [Candidatus Mycoplasma haematolamae str. Purdue]|uniref:Small ribosomal subunit protein bS6 n=1 Tax=Mycoplasma haematolamae (strain Purdue) TaxID=1212765 RepID=I7C533_MYCHA|nr:30S ribosomal protein S6 [Candidatus Mycoplasma haematolamae]AFO51597.1 30S ribosomal protein S6 [Candidatus Mycoplasma haematolamae str. Purdue]